MDDKMEKRMTVALVAHDAMKRDLAEWVAWNWEKLLSHRLVCTGTTGRIVAETLMARRAKSAANSRFDITMLKSGPLGGRVNYIFKESNCDNIRLNVNMIPNGVDVFGSQILIGYGFGDEPVVISKRFYNLIFKDMKEKSKHFIIYPIG